MWASWLGKVSHNKQRQAMNPLLLVAVVAIDAILIKRRQSARDTNTSNATRNKATAKNSVLKPQGSLANKYDKSVVRASWVTGETHLATTIIVAGASIAAKQAWRTQPWSQVTLSTGNTRQIGQIHVPDLIRRERWDQQKKQKQAAKTSAAAMTCGTCVTRTTLAAQTARASWLAVPGTPSPTKQSKREGQQQQKPSWWVAHTHKTNVGCDVLSCSHSRLRAVPQNVWRKIRTSILIGMLCSKMLSRQFWVTSDTDLKKLVQVEKTRAKYVLAGNLGKYNSTDFKTYCTIEITA